MKILCVYYDEEFGSFDKDAECELQGHDVTVAHSYEEASQMLCDPSRGIPPFRVVLMDMVVPSGQESVNDDLVLTYPLVVYLEQNLVDGMGLFLSENFDSDFTYEHDSYLAIVGDCTCWTYDQKRDWQKLLNLVVDKINELDK